MKAQGIKSGTVRRVLRHRLVGARLLLALACTCTGATAEAAERLVVMPFHNASGEKRLEIWGKEFTRWVPHALENAHPSKFKVPGWSEVMRALTNHGWQAQQEVTLEQAQKVAASLRCTTLILGEYAQTEGFWHVTIRVVRPWSGEKAQEILIDELTASGLLAKLMEETCASFGVKPEAQTISLLRDGYQISDATLEKLLKLEKDREAAGEEYIRALREILAAEPECTPARNRLVEALFQAAGKIGTAQFTNNLEAALIESRTLVRQAGQTCHSHIDLAICLEYLGLAQKEYEDELLAALKVHPGCPSATPRLFPFWGRQKRWADIRRVGEEANQASPGKASTLAYLAEARLRLGDKKGAHELVSELDASEEEDWGTHFSLLRTGEEVDNAVMARQVLWIQHRAATNSYAAELMADMDAKINSPRLQERASLSPPRGYTSEELRTELEKRLTPEERSVAISPLEVTDETRSTALAITAGVTNQLLKVILLFGQVTEERLQSTARRGPPEEGPKRVCHYYASRLIALARAVGIPGWLVHVEVNRSEGSGYHDRAALVFGDRLCQTDPTWDVLLWSSDEGSGRILDDLQAIAHHLCQGDDLQAVRIALKLDPDDVWTRCVSIRKLVAQDQVAEAEQLWNTLPAASTNRWDYYLARAAIDAHHGAVSAALKNLKKADELSPKNKDVRRGLRMIAGSGEPEADLEEDRRPAWADRGPESLRIGNPRGGNQTAPEFAMLRPKAKPLPDAAELQQLKQAAETGDAARQEEYGRKLLSLRNESNANEAFEFLRRAARQGHLEAQHFLGEALYSGKLIPKDEAEAAQWLHLSAQNGDQNAARVLKEMELFADSAAFAEGKQRAAAFAPVVEVKDGEGLVADLRAARKVHEYGNKAQALAMITRVAQSPDAPDSLRADALVLQGHFLREQGKLDEAMEAYTRARGIKEAHGQHQSESQVWIGHVLEQQGKLSEAIQAYRGVFTIAAPNPHHLSEAGAALGGVYLRQKDYANAKIEFERVLALPEPVPHYANQARQGLEEISKAPKP